MVGAFEFVVLRYDFDKDQHSRQQMPNCSMELPSYFKQALSFFESCTFNLQCESVRQMEKYLKGHPRVTVKNENRRAGDPRRPLGEYSEVGRCMVQSMGHNRRGAQFVANHS
jgi:hypothetical protein